ncbi:MAG: 2TM domain-containing protein [Bacteroidota bacterium]|uniref:2TM domain-containing protein n=1 Tax=Flagellimonas okinawensis TaxID=3031324 RepID=A0ABT5XJT6_9FLAO|nr:2TM domain-containing protein [[Muricauda] okinawensis]MDF0706148.1 2TM domain-containing protein [[Muricauda] okinawensis]MEC8831713.1 2TM domain-containing protein [Bacteroidota bacterium]
MENSSEQRYSRAKERVEQIKSFYYNLAAYCLVIPTLVYINYKTTSGIPWSIFPAIGWGLGLVGHWMNAYGHNFILGKGWEERKIQEFMNDKEF